MEINRHTRILVTGGTGFVGSHLVESLVEKGCFVVSTHLAHDPFSYCYKQGLDKKVKLVQLDITNFTAIHDVIVKNNIDYIFHLAAQPLVEVAFYNPLRTLESNIMGTVNILESARLFPHIKGIIVASSDKAYGKLTEKKYTENSPLRGDHPYDVSKSAADLICTAYEKTYHLPIAITRFGNIYGEGDLNYSRIIPGIMQSVLNKAPLDIRSNGKYIRDYLYVKDVVNGYIMLAQNIEKARGFAFNFGSHDTHSVIDTIHLAETTLGVKIRYNVLNTAKNEIPYQSLDYSLIKKMFKWEPKYTLKNSLKNVYKWYKKNALYE